MIRGKGARVLTYEENWYNRYENGVQGKFEITNFTLNEGRLQTKLENHFFAHNFQMFKLLSENEIRQVHYNVCLWDQRSCIIAIWNNNLTQLVTTWNQEHIKKNLITNKTSAPYLICSCKTSQNEGACHKAPEMSSRNCDTICSHVVTINYF